MIFCRYIEIRRPMPKLDIHQESDFKAEQTSEQFYSFIVFYTSFRSLAQK